MPAVVEASVGQMDLLVADLDFDQMALVAVAVAVLDRKDLIAVVAIEVDRMDLKIELMSELGQMDWLAVLVVAEVDRKDSYSPQDPQKLHYRSHHPLSGSAWCYRMGMCCSAELYHQKVICSLVLQPLRKESLWQELQPHRMQVFQMLRVEQVDQNYCLRRILKL